MKLFELFLDKIAETKLFEMAFDRQKAKEIVTDLSPQIMEHLFKLYILNDQQDAPHWRSELDAWLRKISNLTLKHNKKPVDSHTLYNWLIFESAPTYNENHIKMVIGWWEVDGYSIPNPDNIDYEFVLNKTFSVINLVCKDIEASKFRTVNGYL